VPSVPLFFFFFCPQVAASFILLHTSPSIYTSSPHRLLNPILHLVSLTRLESRSFIPSPFLSNLYELISIVSIFLSFTSLLCSTFLSFFQTKSL
jgi:hypothetical protein